MCIFEVKISIILLGLDLENFPKNQTKQNLACHTGFFILGGGFFCVCQLSLGWCQLCVVLCHWFVVGVSCVVGGVI